MNTLSLAQFRATQRRMTVEDYCQEFNVTTDFFTDKTACVLCYAEGIEIEQLKDGKFYVLIDRGDYVSTDLARLEELLYQFGAGEYFTGTTDAASISETLKEAAGYYEMDRAIQIILSYLGVPYGDDAGVFFADTEENEWQAMSETDRAALLHAFAIFQQQQIEKHGK